MAGEPADISPTRTTVSNAIRSAGSTAFEGIWGVAGIGAVVVAILGVALYTLYLRVAVEAIWWGIANGKPLGVAVGLGPIVVAVVFVAWAIREPSP